MTKKKPYHNPSKVIGIGNHGCQITDNLAEKSIKNTDFFVCYSENTPLENSRIAGKIIIDEDLKNSPGNTIISENSKEELFSNAPGIVFLLADLKDEWTKKTITLLAQHAKSKNHLTIAIPKYQGKREEYYSLWETNPNPFIDAAFPFANNNSNKDIEQSNNLIQWEIFAKNIINTFNSITNQSEGLMPLDVHDLETILSGSSNTYIGEAIAHGEMDIIQSIDKAFLKEMKDCSKAILFISFSNNEITMNAIGEMTDHLQNLLPEFSTIAWGAGFEDDLNDNLKVTIIASK